MKPATPSGVWANGERELLKEIDQDEKRKLEPLLQALAKNEAERDETKRQIADIKTDFKRKRKKAGGFLFSR
jgi:hypothetical protein